MKEIENKLRNPKVAIKELIKKRKSLKSSSSSWVQEY